MINSHAHLPNRGCLRFFFRFPTKSDGFSTGSGKCHQNHALTEMLLYFDYISIIFDPQGISHGSRPSALSSLPSRSLPTELSQAISHGFLSVHLCRFRIAPPPRGKVNYKREPKHRRCFWEQRKPKENHRIHPAPNQRKSKETKGNRRKPKETKGKPLKTIESNQPKPKPKEHGRIHPAPSQRKSNDRKPKETEGSERKSKDTLL